MITQSKIKADSEVPALRPGLPWLTSNVAPQTEGASYLPSATAQSHQRDRSPTETKIEKKPDLYRDRETSSRSAFPLNLLCIYLHLRDYWSNFDTYPKEALLRFIFDILRTFR